jgi:hypothetical protein
MNVHVNKRRFPTRAEAGLEANRYALKGHTKATSARVLTVHDHGDTWLVRVVLSW